MRTLWRAALLILLCASARAAVVRPAPDLGLEGAARPASLRGLRGQPVVVLIARSARDGDFRKEVYWLKAMFQQFASEKVVFVAAILNGPQMVRSDIPFVIASNPAQVAEEYGVDRRFAIAVIGVDGNLDLITYKVIPASRVRDAIFNNFEFQQESRKQGGI
ncbi:MAG: hypothetical protein ABSE62_04040 [Chthoniobacteraceae bacterium]|jgi:hypothetical protein